MSKGTAKKTYSLSELLSDKRIGLHRSRKTPSSGQNFCVRNSRRKDLQESVAMNPNPASIQNSYNGTLSIQRVASCPSSLTFSSQFSDQTSKARKDVAHITREESDEEAYRTFVRLLKTSQFINDVTRADEQRPFAPPASPAPSQDNDDKVTNDAFKVGRGGRQKHAKNGYSNGKSKNERNINYTTMQSNVMMNNWLETHNPNRDAWLVMRGHNIRLHHQDQVRRTFNQTRQIQSASVMCNRTPSIGLTPRIKFREHKSRSILPSYKVSRSAASPQRLPRTTSCYNTGMHIQKLGNYLDGRFNREEEKLLQAGDFLKRPKTTPLDFTMRQNEAKTLRVRKTP